MWFCSSFLCLLFCLTTSYSALLKRSKTSNNEYRHGGLLAGCAVALAIILYSSAASAQSAPESSMRRDAQGIQHLESAINMMGSPQLFASLHTAIIHGTIYAPGNPSAASGTFTAKLIGKHHFIETIIGQHRTRLTIHGTRGNFDHDGTAKPFHPSGIADISSDLFPFFDNWATFHNPNVAINLLDDKAVEGIECYQILVGTPANFAIAGHSTYDINVFVSKSDGTLKAVDYGLAQTSFYNPKLRGRIVYEDYKTLDNVTLPTKITRYINGVPVTILHVDALDTHQNLTEKDLDF